MVLLSLFSFYAYTVYKATDFVTHPSGGKLTIKFEPNDKSAETVEHIVHEFDGPGVAMAMFNTDKSIEGFARGTLSYAESRRLPVILGHKSTILKQYDHAWISTFERIAKAEFPAVDYSERLIDDLVAYMMKNGDPVLYALKVGFMHTWLRNDFLSRSNFFFSLTYFFPGI